ncbi:MAG: C_GCAxxG_C_C family protein [Thermoplasmata archaeon]|nr:MAG: C_GCAxxG_C_C family protein [Thermoplasmata archaeon]
MTENSKINEAVKYFEGDWNCCQSIIMTYGPQYGLPKDTSAHMGTSFAGGMARRGEVCGAVTGALMIIGLKYGMTNETDSQARDKTYELVNEFMDTFKAKHESLRCRDLLDCDLTTAEGRKTAQDKGLFKTLCPELVKSAAEILEELI